MSQPARLDAEGNATLEVELPDYNGEVQLIATVYSADKFGQAVRDLTVAAPIVAELSFPRFLAPWDKSRLTLELSNRSDRPQTVNYRVYAEEPLTLEPLQAPLQGERQLEDPKIGLTHNLGGMPFMSVVSVAIVGKYGQ